jgi:VanZ family protein
MNRRYAVAALLWMGVIFIFSTDVGSYKNVGGFLKFLLRLFDLTTEQWDRVVYAIRKAAHATEYAILSILWGLALLPRMTLPAQSSPLPPRFIPAIGALLVCGVWAGLDEYHQSLVASRTSSLTDVGIDFTGALVAQIFLMGRIELSSPSRYRTLQFFGWWFAWGMFSSIMLLIVWKGGPFPLLGRVAFIVGSGLLSGAVGAVYHVRHVRRGARVTPSSGKARAGAPKD